MDNSDRNDSDEEVWNDDDLVAIDLNVAATINCKRAAAPAAIVTPEKAKKSRNVEGGYSNLIEEDNSNRVTADTVMGFPKYPTLTNGEIMMQHYNFVSWAKSKKSAGGRLKAFLEWVETLKAIEGPMSRPRRPRCHWGVSLLQLQEALLLTNNAIVALPTRHSSGELTALLLVVAVEEEEDLLRTIAPHS